MEQAEANRMYAPLQSLLLYSPSAMPDPTISPTMHPKVLSWIWLFLCKVFTCKVYFTMWSLCKARCTSSTFWCHQLMWSLAGQKKLILYDCFPCVHFSDQSWWSTEQYLLISFSQNSRYSLLYVLCLFFFIAPRSLQMSLFLFCLLSCLAAVFYSSSPPLWRLKELVLWRNIFWGCVYISWNSKKQSFSVFTKFFINTLVHWMFLRKSVIKIF